MDRFAIGRREFLEIAVSVVVVALAFSLYPAEDVLFDPAVFAVMLVAVGTGFVFHELAHRQVAIEYGALARYHAWTSLLALALVLAVATGGNFVFAAPGAVYIFGRRLSPEKYGKVSLAGPAANLAMSLFFRLLVLAGAPFAAFWFFCARTNAFLGLFNLLPFAPLDGSKVFAWDKKAWAGAAAALLASLFLPY